MAKTKRMKRGRPSSSASAPPPGQTGPLSASSTPSLPLILSPSPVRPTPSRTPAVPVPTSLGASLGGLRIMDTSWEGVAGVEDSIVSLAGITMNHSVTVSGGHAPYSSSPAVGGTSSMRHSPPHTCSAWRARGQQAQGDVGGIHKAVPGDVLSHLQGFQYFRADGTVADDSFPNRALPAVATPTKEGGGGDRDSRVEMEGPVEGLPLLGRLLGSSAAERAAAEKAHADVKKTRDLASHKLPGVAAKHPAAGVEVRHASVYVCSVCSVCRCVGVYTTDPKWLPPAAFPIAYPVVFQQWASHWHLPTRGRGCRRWTTMAHRSTPREPGTLTLSLLAAARGMRT